MLYTPARTEIINRHGSVSLSVCSRRGLRDMISNDFHIDYGLYCYMKNWLDFGGWSYSKMAEWQPFWISITVYIPYIFHQHLPDGTCVLDSVHYVGLSEVAVCWLILVNNLISTILLDTCYSVAYMSQTQEQQRFMVSEVTADWHELMIPQHIMQPSIAHANRYFGPAVQLADIPPPQSTTLGLHPVAHAR